MHIIPHNLLSDERMWAHPCCTHIPPSQEQVPPDEAREGCRDEFVRGLGRHLTVNYGCWIVVFVWCNYLTILYRTPLYIKDVTFVPVPWVIIYVRLDPNTLGDYFAPRFGPLKLGCDNMPSSTLHISLSIWEFGCKVVIPECRGNGHRRGENSAPLWPYVQR
jgi:hypothetical protein